MIDQKVGQATNSLRMADQVEKKKKKKTIVESRDGGI